MASIPGKKAFNSQRTASGLTDLSSTTPPVVDPRPTILCEIYTDERVAEFLLTNAVDVSDYLAACAEVRSMGLDPAKITHQAPMTA
jgi:murein L,D-transpeptidase YcbB/YkuD